MLSKEQYEKLKYQIAMHKPLNSVVAMSVDSVESLFQMIDTLEENATAQALALKAAKAMQQAETERADANERDAARYRYLRNAGMNERNMLEHYAWHALDYAIDRLMARSMANSAASRMPKPDLGALRAINKGEDLPCGK